MNIDVYEENEEYQETAEERRMRDERFIEKFFTERELIVDFDNTSESDEENAQAWYEAVEKTISNLSTYQHDNMGRPLNHTDPANTNGTDSESADQIIPNKPDNKTINSRSESQIWLFRGQKDTKFAFTSTLYRRALNSNPHKLRGRKPQIQPLEKRMIEAEVNLLNKAWENGIGRGLTALETLTLLQHHGSPTRLIDVTTDWLVALFFACEDGDDRDGRIFLINTNLSKWENFPKEKSESKRSKQLIWQEKIERWHNLDKLLENPTFSTFWSTTTWPILLPFSDPRMISQRGFFITGGIPCSKNSVTLYTSRCSNCNENRCKCAGSTILPRSIKPLQKADEPTHYPLNREEFRMITSLPIDFRNDSIFFHEIKALKTPQHRAAGYSIRVPKHYKRKLREILRDKGVHTDSIYPPLRETVRLFEHVVDESFKQ